MPLIVALLAAVVLAPQGPDARPPAARPPLPIATRVTAARAVRPPVIDGKDDDSVWAVAPAVTEFREWQPVEDGEARFRTVARIAYDANNLYAFVRAYDPHPDSIMRPLSRRDNFGPSDRIWILIDSYHDRRTGYEFGVTPAGVKLDIAISNDGNEDMAWDGVWDVATLVDSLGWTAEFRIPLSQIRYPRAASHTFGIMILRDIYRYTERLSWPVFRQSRSGFVSQFGEVSGLDGLASPRRLELAPYTVTKNVSVPTATGFRRSQDFTVGANLKYGITSNLTLDGTVNPDFGQVEADPSVLNLSAFETFFQERRPFFVEGAGIFRFDVDCSQVNCNGEGLFYSRRIGRAPQLGGLYGTASSATATTILGATKLTGRLPSGLSIGVLEAVTQRATGRADTTIEPRTNYSVLRLQRDLRGGQSGVGLLFTGVDRALDAVTDTLLRREAYVGALDARHRFANATYEISASLDVSRVAGTRQAIAATQRDAVHFYQRPDAGLPFDPTRTALTGDAEEIHFGKVAGKLTNWETSYLRRSPGFEVNDLGFLLRADQQSWNNWLGLRFNHPTRLFRSARWNFNWWQYWSAGGLPEERAFNTNVHSQLNNRWWFHAGGTLGQFGTTYCDRCARGGPAVRQERYIAPWGGIGGDDRNRFIPYFWVNYWRGEGGRGESLNLGPELDFKAASNMTGIVAASYTHNRDDYQWFGNFTDPLSPGGGGATHYTFAHLEQRTLSLTGRLDYTLTTTLTLQVYAQPFVSKGVYANVRELAAPRAADYNARFRPYGDTSVTNNPGGFNFKQFRSNVVMRWEYRPGSTLYLVWTQGRQGFLSAMGDQSFSGDFRDLFNRHPNNTFLVKASYWLNW
ncbi:MAG TPA: DUF5916 domain-containing protein [Gemmatimonadales bacterium]|nr:DUF5916 domain-containing protein [Gemmatimonadales bacterium]